MGWTSQIGQELLWSFCRCTLCWIRTTGLLIFTGLVLVLRTVLLSVSLVRVGLGSGF